MARLNGILKIEGTLDNLTFYKTADGHMVRTKGGVSKDRIMNDPAFIRTRENGTEFGEIASSGKLLRRAAGPLIFKAKDGKLSSRLMGEMSRIKNLDITSARGERKVAVGIETVGGKQVLTGFNLNNRAHLSTVLRSVYELETATGEVTIADFVPGTALAYPQHATHVSLSCGFLNLDFATGIYAMELSPVVNTAINMTSSAVVLTPNDVPAGSGTQFYFLLIEYFQMVNAVQYPLNNGAFNALTILDVV